LKPSPARIAIFPFLRFQRTYEELKLVHIGPGKKGWYGFQRTYEELKQGPGMKKLEDVFRFQRTYEELKHPYVIQRTAELSAVFSVPMRN